MSYDTPVTRGDPTLLLYLVDQSGAMAEPYAGSGFGQSKAEFVASAVNRHILNVVLQAATDMGVKDFFSIGIIGYGGTGVATGFGGALAGRTTAWISEVAHSPVRVEDRTKNEPDGAGGILEMKVKSPVWLEPKAGGAAPMSEAFDHARAVAACWIAEHPRSFPPFVMNFTSGETDRDPFAAAGDLRDLASGDGSKLILMNVHVGSPRSVVFPSSESELLPRAEERLLFRMSSNFPEDLCAFGNMWSGFPPSLGRRGFVSNAGSDELSVFLGLIVGWSMRNTE